MGGTGTVAARKLLEENGRVRLEMADALVHQQVLLRAAGDILGIIDQQQGLRQQRRYPVLRAQQWYRFRLRAGKPWKFLLRKLPY